MDPPLLPGAPNRAAPSPPARSWVAAAAIGSALALGATLLVQRQGGFGARIVGADLYGVFIGKYEYIAETLWSGRLPLWNPWEYTGVPLHGLSQGGVFYLPIALAYLLLRRELALPVLYAAHLALLLGSMLLLQRRHVSLAPACAGACLAAAALFRSDASIALDHPNYLFEIAFIPAMLVCADSIRRGRWTALPVLALLAGIQWLPGYPEIPMNTALVLAVAVAAGPGGQRRGLTGLGLALLLGALLAAVHLIPLWEAIGESWRGEVASQGNTRLYHTVALATLIPHTVGRYGAVAIFCLVLGLATRGRQRWVWLAAFLMGTFPAQPPFSLLFEIWPFSRNRFSFGWSCMAALFAGLLVARGLEHLRSRSGPLRLEVAGASLFAIVLQLAGAPVRAAEMLLCALAMATPKRLQFRWLVPLGLVVLQSARILDTLGAVGRSAPDFERIAQAAPVLRALHARLPGKPRVVSSLDTQAANYLRERIPSPTGHEPALLPRRIARLDRHTGLSASALGSIPTLPLLRRGIHVANALGVGVVVSPGMHEEAWPQMGFRTVHRFPDGRVAVYRPAVPRFRIVHKARYARDADAAFRLTTRRSFRPGSEVILEAPQRRSRPPNRAPGSSRVRVLTDEPERQVAVVHLTQPGFLVIGDTWYPGWEARVDGRPVPILRANYAHRAISLPPGRHRVELDYRPASVRVGMWITLAAGLTILTLGLVARRLDRRRSAAG